MIDIRHYLNNSLKQFGGNIGYSVRKSESNKGYAKQMLKLALEKCKDLKMKKVLITCDEDNIASKKVILSAGAKLEDIRSINDKNKKRFWIEL
ncbi:GNAT family N-acetyltransferase [Fusobacterium polymorphum]|uniref:GNAT family N-acetyltransferase n=1 Tax=Fusobacterium nucleatum subsp. polymorphum TaxID=76857 RepID=A0A2B7YNQ3_FUSNP|nr:GNAT family N-acetyltransferase [Fusobacterium polymorphum]